MVFMSFLFLLPGIDEGGQLLAGALTDVNAVGITDVNNVQIVAVA